MSWFLIVIAVILLWVSSLLKILHESRSTSRDVVCNNGEIRKRNVLLIIAHPDDESMFFSPTINHLISRGHNIHVLCCSNGNADGMGNIRKEELYRACVILKVPLHQVKILDHHDMQDGFGQKWNLDLLAKIVEEEVSTHSIDSIITFDNYGISGHCNHRDVHHGIHKMLCETSQGNVEAWELISTNILRKYSGPLDVWLSIVYAMHQPSEQILCLLNKQPRKSFLAMAQHLSQWVWFRKLFVLFSSYTYVNTLRKFNN